MLSEFEFAEINYVPRQELADVYTDELGFLDFGSRSVILNLGTMLWMMLFYLLKVGLVKVIFRIQPSIMKLRTWAINEHKTIFYNDIID